MAVMAVFEAPGMTAGQYDEVIRKLDEAGAGKPDGRLYHVATQRGNGWFVIDVWESPEKLQSFASILMPLLQGVGVTPPQPELLPAHNIIAG